VIPEPIDVLMKVTEKGGQFLAKAEGSAK